MKKYFLFAAVAGMLASCSSESLTAGSDSKIEQPTQDDRVAIEIGVATTQQKAITRGTGTAGGTGVAGDENIWRGERINVMMYQITNDLPTFNYTEGGATGNTPLYNNTSMVTPLKEENTSTGIAKEPSDAANIGYASPQNTYVVKYYPSTGKSDFWGYYLGGYGYTPAPAAPAAGDAAGDGTLTMYTDVDLADEHVTTDETGAVCVATGFVINGTHDLLVGKATSSDANAYSAKAARAGVQPNITFKHLLSRLQFKVKPGLASGDGIKVTAIKVRSKKTGKMIVAYKYKDGNGDVAEPTRIVWDATEAGYTYDDPLLPQLELQQRNAGTGAMEGINPPGVTLAWDPNAYVAVANGTTLTAGKTYYTDNTGGGAFAALGTEVADGTNYFDKVGAGVLKPVGEALIVAPQAKYQIEVDYEMDVKTAREWYSSITAVANGTTLTAGKTYYTDNTGGGAFVAVGNEIADGTNFFESTYDEGALTGLGTTYKAKLITDLVRTATSGSPATPKAFEGGESYLVTITLYGPQEIKITTTLDAWNASDQNIEIGQD